MKRSSILFILFFIPSMILAQQTSEEEKEPEVKVEKSELKLNMLEMAKIAILHERGCNFDLFSMSRNLSPENGKQLTN